MPHRPDPVAILDRIRRRLDQERYRLVYCNRDIDLRGIRWVGFDMDYTLAIYHREAFDALCHQETIRTLVANGYPEAIRDIPFDPDFAIRGLVIDRQTGHILKLDSHRSVVYGYHGLRRLEDTELEPYRRQPPVIGAARGRYTLVDTLFELPEAWLYAALVDRLEALGLAPDYAKLADDVRGAVDGVHADGSLKGPIQQDLERYVQRDPDLPSTLHRLRSAGKKLFLMTKTDQILIIIKHGIIFFQSFFYIDLLVTVRKAEPWLTGRKSCIFAVIPLHRNPGIEIGRAHV